jgi:glycosyltransferase involved in cell wall biosynthesis
VSDETVVELMEGCNALCVAAEEDFGIAAVEAQAAGKPVVAYGRGGSLETIDEGETGVFFRERTEESVLAAIRTCDELDVSPERTAERARRFSRTAFEQRLQHVLADALARRANGSGNGTAAGHNGLSGSPEGNGARNDHNGQL